MKRLLGCTGLLLAACILFAQTGKSQTPAPSPATTESATIGGKSITIKYSSPRVRGREGKIFTKDGLIQQTHKSYPVWRGGANSATTLITTGDLTIGGLAVPAGTYTLFVDISDPAQWSLIVSKATGEWGLSYDPSKDLGRTKMTMAKTSSMVEELKYTLKDNGGGKGTLNLTWEDVSATVPVIAN